MGRIIAISSGDLSSTMGINRYAVDRIESETKNFLFVGTASKDAKEYIEGITKTFADLGCRVRSLDVVTKAYDIDEIWDILAWADIIYIGGGDTVYMMDIWEKCGLDDMLREIYRKDRALLMGISAGAICWFDCGCSDSELLSVKDGLSYGWAEDMLGLHKYAFCPHYEEREEEFSVLLQEKTIEGLALESNTAFVEENGEIYYLKCKEEASAYLFEYRDGIYIRRKLDTRLVR